MSERRGHNIWLLIFAVLLPNIGGWIGAALWQDQEWYDNLQQPIWRPPNWAFPIVWTIIYCLIGISSYLLWKSGETGAKVYLAWGTYCIQLILNWIWTPLFFVWQLILVSMVDLILLWVVVAIMIWLFHRVDKKSSYPLVPYLVWITIANTLNISYYVLNPDA